MTNNSVTMRITAVRRRGDNGGAIVAGTCLAQHRTFVALIPYSLLPDSQLIEVGQNWRITGEIESKTRTLPHGQVVIEPTISANDAEMLELAAENLIEFIAQNKNIRGVGYVKARSLHAKFGKDLVSLIQQGDIESLMSIVSQESAELLIAEFKKLQIGEALNFLDRVGVKRTLGRKIVNFYGDDTESRITSDPYLLLSFGVSWSKVDKFALEKINISIDSKVRLRAAVEESLYRCFDLGSTAAFECEVRVRLKSILKQHDLIDSAVELGSAEGQYFKSENLFHPAGPLIMEQKIVKFIKTAIEAESGQEQLFNFDISPDDVIKSFEKSEGYELTDEQREAVKTSSSNRFSLILGGAGVGKTTVLKCIYEVIKTQEPLAHIIQLALSGKAALRMTESTNLEAFTIARFIRTSKTGDLPKGAWVVIDEASMIDLLSTYRLFDHLPADCKVILIGDPYQLPPVGPGLILHRLVGHERVPQTELKVVKRQTEESGIPQVARSIRKGKWPDFSPFRGGGIHGVSFLKCEESQINSNVVEVYQALKTGSESEVQILSPTTTGIGGTEPLNIAMQSTTNSSSPIISYYDEEYAKTDFLYKGQSFRVGDPVIFVKNDYQRELRNGTLGTIVKQLIPKSPEDCACVANMDGALIELNVKDLSSLKLAYAITVHKSQGSQFKQVIVPIRKNRLLDLTLLYTAITRAVDQVVLIGDVDAAKKALSKISANTRTVGFLHESK
jgi:exodeoxyribonuclease V alpha subunit